MEVDVAKSKSKKRLPSGSPDGKLWDSINTGSVSDDEDINFNVHLQKFPS